MSDFFIFVLKLLMFIVMRSIVSATVIKMNVEIERFRRFMNQTEIIQYDKENVITYVIFWIIDFFIFQIKIPGIKNIISGL